MLSILFSLGMPEPTHLILLRALLYYATPIAVALVLLALLRQPLPGLVGFAIYAWWPVPFFVWLLGTLWVEGKHGPFSVAGFSGPALRGANTAFAVLAGVGVAVGLVLHRITARSPAIARLSFWFMQLLAIAAAVYGAAHHLGAPLH